jgi:flagellar hook assembly protein FlgD
VNHPNPFNPSTKIKFSIQNESNVEISIYNIKGRKIKQLVHNQLSTGQHSVVWNGTDNNNEPVSSGVYLYKLNVNCKTEAVKKCMLLK